MVHLSVDDVLDIHTAVINTYGGIHGVRDKGLLYSIVNGIYQTYSGDDLYPTDKDKVCRLYYMFVTNQVFLDGNKRNATALFFMLNKKYNLRSKLLRGVDSHKLSLDVASGKVSYEELLEMW